VHRGEASPRQLDGGGPRAAVGLVPGTLALLVVEESEPPLASRQVGLDRAEPLRDRPRRLVLAVSADRPRPQSHGSRRGRRPRAPAARMRRADRAARSGEARTRRRGRSRSGSARSRPTWRESDGGGRFPLRPGARGWPGTRPTAARGRLRRAGEGSPRLGARCAPGGRLPGLGGCGPRPEPRGLADAGAGGRHGHSRGIGEAEEVKLGLLRARLRGEPISETAAPARGERAGHPASRRARPRAPRPA